MGLFDGFEAGWNSFKNNELKAAGDFLLAPNPIVKPLLAPNPIVKAITNPQKAIEQPETLLPLGNNGPVEQWEEVGEDAANTLLAPNPLISLATGNGGDIPQTDKPAADKWQNVADKTVNKAGDVVKETIQNVTQGVGSALPILAIGGGVILAASLLFGRK